MMRNVLFCFVLLFIGSSFTNNKQKVFDIHFEKDDDFIAENSLETLEEIIVFASEAEHGYQISLEVFPASDKALPRARLDELTSYFEEESIEVGRVLFYTEKEHLPEHLQGHGDFDFIRLTIQQKESPQELVKKITPVTNSKAATTSDKMPKWAEKVVDYPYNVEEFTINNFAESKIKTADGSQILFPSEMFVHEDGSPVTQLVNITTKFATTKNLALLEDLTTTYQDGLLESRGMIYVNATSQGKQLKIADGKSYEIRIRTEEYEEGFQTFYGERNDQNGYMDWTLDKRSIVRLNDTTKRDYAFYTFQRISQDKKEEYKEFRAKQIEYWEKMGEPKATIKRRLDYAKNYTDRKEKRFMRKRYHKDTGEKFYARRYASRRHPYFKVRADRTPIKENKWYKIGQPKFKFVEVDIPEPDGKRKKFRKLFYVLGTVASLGFVNCDRLRMEMNAQPQCNMIVNAGEHENIKLIFKNSFIILKGIGTRSGHTFPTIPIGEPVTILASSRQADGSIRYALHHDVANNKTIQMTDYQTVSEGAFIQAVESLKL